MRYVYEIHKILADAYISLANEALKNKSTRTDKIVRCCKCGKCNVTLRKIHTDIYACDDCVNERAIQEMKAHSQK